MAEITNLSIDGKVCGSSIRADKRGAWKTSYELDLKTGEVIGFSARSEKYGSLAFGERCDGHIGWWWEEEGGGGPITLPYSFDQNGQLLIALRNEMRANLGGRRWCAIGGFKKPDETNDHAQAREAADEAGIDTSQAALSPGLPLVSNRNYFVADPDKDEGIHVYFLPVPFQALVPTENGSYGLLKVSLNFQEQQYVRFFPWAEAMFKTCDMIAVGGMGRLVAYLENDPIFAKSLKAIMSA